MKTEHVLETLLGLALLALALAHTQADGSGPSAWATVPLAPSLETVSASHARAVVAAVSHTVVIDSTRASGGTGYRIRAGGAIEAVGGRLEGRPVESEAGDAVDGRTARGRVDDGADGFRVHGAIERIYLDQPENATVYVNGRRYQVTTGPDHVIVIIGVRCCSQYLIEVDGHLDQIDGRLDGMVVTQEPRYDTVYGPRARGRVETGTDGFHVFGTIERIVLEEPRNARVLVDGKPFR